jgi:hypothetical protein
MVTVNIPPCKTDKTGKKYKLSVSELDEKDREICAFKNILALVQLKGESASPSEDLFSLPAYGIRKVRYKSFTTCLVRHLKSAGYDGYFRSHSFRRGAASSCMALGYTLDQVRALGRWSSDACLKYVVWDMRLFGSMASNIASLKMSGVYLH